MCSVSWAETPLRRNVGRKYSQRAVDSDPIASGTSRGCYIIKELGESEKDVLGDVCTEHWDERDKGPVLNEVSCSFNYEVRARVDGPFVLTRTNAIFATEDRFRTSVSLEIGKCSLFEG